LLRNAIVHGIESPEERKRSSKREEGLISIQARQDGELVRIEFSDDGRGVDVDRVRRRAIAMGTIDEEHAARLDPAELARLVFTSGLSTAATTTELAGRGVGLDVVSSVIDRMGGTVTLETITGVGTKFVLQVPVSLSLTRALFLEAADQVFAVPNAAVVEVYRLPVREIRTIEGRETTTFRGKLLPLVRLREALGLKGIKDIFVNKVGVVVLRSGEDMAGFLVDNLIGEREIVARPFGAYLGRAHMVSGVTLMENGDVVLILHPPDLLRSLHETKRQRGHGGEARGDGSERRILYAEDSIITREYAAGVLRSRGFHVVEASDGVEAFERLQAERFDLLLTDLQMPRMDGFKLCAQVRRDPQLRNLPIVVMSTLDTPETKRMALDAGADAYLVKSGFAADTLVATIGHVIR
jgi:chemotaxis protein histidine kinase CheA/CheY-like chemotaxis protein